MNDFQMVLIAYLAFVGITWYSVKSFDTLKNLELEGIAWFDVVFICPLTLISVLYFGFSGLLVGLLALGVAHGLVSFMTPENNQDEQHIRGVQLQDARDHKFLAKKVDEITKEAGRIPTTIGGVPIPHKDEARGILFVGMQGAGKSQAQHELIDKVRDRDERGIVFDESSDYVTKHFNDGDVYINFLDYRGVGWTATNEIKNIEDCPTVARGLVPEGATKQQEEWNGYARDLLEVILEKMFELGLKKNSDLFRLVLLTPPEELGQLAQGTTSEIIFRQGNEKLLGSVQAVLASNIKPLKYVPDGDFSVRDFVQDEIKNKGKFLFLSANSSQLKAIAPIYRSIVDLSIVYLNAMTASDTRRLWFFLDELPALGTLGELDALLNRGRKRGGCCVVGLQSTFYFDEMYSREKKPIIMGGFGTLVAMRTPDEKSGEELAAQLGRQDLIRAVKSESEGASGGGTSKNKSTSYQVATDQKLITATQLTGLADLNGYLKRVGEGINSQPKPILRIVIPVKNRKDVFDAFVQRKVVINTNEDDRIKAVNDDNSLAINRENEKSERRYPAKVRGAESSKVKDTLVSEKHDLDKNLDSISFDQTTELQPIVIVNNHVSLPEITGVISDTDGIESTFSGQANYD